MIKNILLSFLLVIPLFLTAQNNSQEEKVQLKVILHYQDSYIKAVLDDDELIEWTRVYIDTVKAVLTPFNTDHTVNLITVFRPDQKVEYRINIYPDNTVILELLKQKLSKLQDLRTRYAEYAQQTIVTLNSGGCADESCWGDIKFPDQDARLQLEKASIAETYQTITEWAKQMQPLLAKFEVSVDKKFAGVRYVGGVMQKDISTVDVSAATSGNDLYWRGVMEMANGNHIIPVSMVVMYLAKGETERAISWIRVVNLFNYEDGLAQYLLEEATWRVGMLNDKCAVEIQKGIALHDKGKYNQAIEVYKRLLAVYPHSAWAWHELFLSSLENLENASTEETGKLWNHYADSIYSENPLYAYRGHANTAKEGFEISRRMSLSQLFKKKEDLKKDLVSYAEICMDLGYYDYAAEVYWYVSLNVKAEDFGKKSFLPYYLYCMKKLGHTTVLKFFKEEFDKDYARIDKEMDKRMKSDFMYKAMGNKE